MNERPTIEYIKEYMEGFGYKCLSKEYINSITKLILECNKGHIYKVGWSNFKRGSRCLTCSGRKRKTIEEVSEYVERFGYKCLSKEYINSYTKLEFQCDKGHIYKVIWRSLQQGHRCPMCFGGFGGKGRLTIEEIKEHVGKSGYICISEKYVNAYTKLEFQCNKGHLYKALYNSFKQGSRCPTCFGSKKKTIEEINKYAEKFDYKCLSNDYIGAHSKLKFECDKYHIYTTSWTELQIGHRCPICALEKISGRNNYRWRDYSEEDRKNIELYRDEIDKLSNINYVLYKNMINPDKLRRGNKYHLDHIYSVIDGFNNGIPPNVIANPYNLRVIDCAENIRKSGNSHMTIEQLYISYLCFLLKQKMEDT